MSLLAGTGLRTCKYRKCGKSFDRKGTNRKFCTEKCKRSDSAAKLCERRKAERFLIKGTCRNCKLPFKRRSSNPERKFLWCGSVCSHQFRSRKQMRALRDERKLLDLGWVRVADKWADPEARYLCSFRDARKHAGFTKKPPRYEFQTDEITVWVNGEDSLLGRFGKFGIDIHRPLSEQMDKGECLHCTHELTGINEWHIFVRKMLEYFGIDLTHDRYMPKRLKRKDGIDVGKRRDRSYGTKRTYAPAGQAAG